MAALQTINIKENKKTLAALLRWSTQASKPRIKMLLAILRGVTSTQDLVHETRSNRDTIRNWKSTYTRQGITGLIEETRGRKKSITVEKDKLVLRANRNYCDNNLTN